MPATEKSAPTILKTVELLANRALGPVIQRIEAKHAHLDLNKTVFIDRTPEDSLQRLEELNRKLFSEMQPATPMSDSD